MFSLLKFYWTNASVKSTLEKPTDFLFYSMQWIFHDLWWKNKFFFIDFYSLLINSYDVKAYTRSFIQYNSKKKNMFFLNKPIHLRLYTISIVFSFQTWIIPFYLRFCNISTHCSFFHQIAIYCYITSFILYDLFVFLLIYIINT